MAFIVLKGRLLQEFHWICLLTETALPTLCSKNYLRIVIYIFVTQLADNETNKKMYTQRSLYGMFAPIQTRCSG